MDCLHDVVELLPLVVDYLLIVVKLIPFVVDCPHDVVELFPLVVDYLHIVVKLIPFVVDRQLSA